MNKWEIKTAYARVAFTSDDPSALSDFFEQLVKIPGCKNYRGVWQIPANAIEVVQKLCQSFTPGVSIQAASWVKKPRGRASWEDVKSALLKKGEVQPWVLDGFLTQYQEDALCFGWNQEGVHFWHPTGSGKTLSGILCGLSVDGPLVVVTRAASRLQYAREIERFLNVRAYVIRPEGQKKGMTRVQGETWNEFRSRHKGQGYTTRKMGKLWKAHQEEFGIDQAESLRDYMRSVAHRPCVVVGWEALTTNVKELVALRPGAVIYDESHRGKHHKRYEVVYLGDPPDDPEAARDWLREHEAAAKRQDGFIKDDEEGYKLFTPYVSTASAAAMLAKAAKKRILTTATPVKDRVRDLWAQLDLAEPNAWGNSSVWRYRHADMKPGKYGGMDDRGSSNLDELNMRLKKVAHILKYEDTHRHLPQKRRQSFYISPSDQCPPSAGYPKELREAKKRGASHVLEVKLAQAASGKRKAVLNLVEDHVGSNQKIVIFTGRKRDCDKLGEAVRKNKLVKKKEATVWVAHGAQSTAVRQDIIDEYMAHPGPCVLVGTGHAFGESLNIHDTDAALFVMLPYTPGQLRQWEGRFCLLAGQMVLTEEGTKNIEDVQVGDRVLSHRGRWCRVAKTRKRNLKTAEGGLRSCITKLRVVGLIQDTEVTGDHRLLVSINGGEPDWIEASRIAPGDELVTPRLPEVPGEVVQLQFPQRCRVNEDKVKNSRYVKMPDWITIDDEVAWLMGHFCGDGWTSASTTHFIGIASHEGERDGHLHRVDAVCQRWGINTTCRKATIGKGLNLYAYSKEAALWFRSLFGESSREKRVPSMVFSWPDRLKKAFLEGYWDADGHLREDKEQQWTTVSPHLALGMFHLASGLGWPVVTSRAAKGQYLGSYNPRSKARVDEKYVYRKVLEVHTRFGRGKEKATKVYDIEVTEDESFCANGIVAHNCRLGQKRPVVIYYIISEDTVDEHVASILIDKLPAVEEIADDTELAAARGILAGIDESESDDDFVDAILADLDFD